MKELKKCEHLKSNVESEFIINRFKLVGFCIEKHSSVARGLCNSCTGNTNKKPKKIKKLLDYGRIG